MLFFALALADGKAGLLHLPRRKSMAITVRNKIFFFSPVLTEGNPGLMHLLGRGTIAIIGNFFFF